MRGIRAALIGLVALGAVVPGIVGTERAAAWDGTFSVQGSVEQFAVTHAAPGAALELWDAHDAVVATGTVDAQGSFLFRSVAPGAGYRVVQDDAGTRTISAAAVVMDATTDPPQSFYDAQVLTTGFGYITTRDGTKLSATVRLPGPPENGPYPTVIEYSGYSASHPSSPQPSTLLAGALGYATVGVNIRGTGCSGGSFFYFEQLESLDGYDVVEAVAAQPWVLHHEPGMVGISYPGIAQLFTAREQPPHLAAIAPLSVIADTYRSTLYPGGIFNDGFALDWARERVRDGRPYGQGWEHAVVDAGGAAGEQCAENQLLRLQNPDLEALINANTYYVDFLNDPLSPETFVDQIDVPVLLGGAFQDEQTGGHFANLLDDFTNSPDRHFLITNGAHVDSLVAQLDRWYEFLEFYVARRVPNLDDGFAAIVAPVVGDTVGIQGVPWAQDRFVGMDYASALSAYRAEGDLRVIFENGWGNPAIPGAPVGTFEHTFSQWPPAETSATTWYLQPDGGLGPNPSGIDAIDPRGATSYQYDPTAKIAKTIAGGTGDAWVNTPAYDWRALPDGKSLAFETAALADDVVMVGTGRFDVWLRSTALDTDVEVTLTEIRPDGQERYVQNGWLRASHRQLEPSKTTALRPFHTDREVDASDLTSGEFAELNVEIFPFAHVFRAGSRIRVSVEAPGGNRPAWTLDALEADGVVTNEVAHSVQFASRVTLPVIPGLAPPAALPPCPSLRGQPCRAYVAPSAPTDVTATMVGDESLRVEWSAPARPGATSYDIVDIVTGASMSATTTQVQFDGVAPGPHAFSVTARFGELIGARSTPSGMVVVQVVEPTTTTTAAATTTSEATSTTLAAQGSTTSTAAATSTTSSATSNGGGSLPFTGFALGGIALAGGAAFALGRTLRRRPRPTT
jgi:predicted acyl esterase